MRFYYTHIRITKIKKDTIPSFGEDLKGLEFLPTADKNLK